MTYGLKHPGHFNAKSIDEAVSLLSKYKGGKVMAGGTDLLRVMKNRVVMPEVLVNIKTIPDMAYIKEDAGGLRLGALTLLNDIEVSPLVRDKYPMLAEAAYSVASPTIRNMGTVGGNLCQDVQCWYYRRSPVTGNTFFCLRKGGKVCQAVAGENAYHAIIGQKGCFAPCPSDMAPALMALGATLKIAGPGGERVVPLDGFYLPLGNILKPDEMITEIAVPLLKAGTRQRYLKFRLRKTIDFAIVSVAAAITTESGRVSQAGIVLGGIAPVPYRFSGAEEMLKGQAINEPLAEAAAAVAIGKGKPLRKTVYKLPITRALVKRAILGLK